MTEPQPDRPGPGSAAGVSGESSAAGQPRVPPRVPPQATRPAPGQPGGPGSQSDAPGSGAVGESDPGPGGLAVAIAGKAWAAALIAAIAMIAVGIMLLVWPAATLTVVAFLIGAALIVSGLLRLFDGAVTRDETGGTRAADVVIGLLAVIAGLYCFKHHSLTVLVLALVVGLFWVIHGLGSLIVAATSGKVPGRGLRAIGGLVSVAAGLVLLFWPGLSLVLLLTILGAWLIFYGAVLAGLAFGLRRDVRARSQPPRMAPA